MKNNSLMIGQNWTFLLNWIIFKLLTVELLTELIIWPTGNSSK